MNKNIKKIINNKVFLFIVPNLIYLSGLFNRYNINIKGMTEFLFSEILIVFFIFFGISVLLYIFLSSALSDNKKVFLLMCFCLLFYFVRFNALNFWLFVLWVLFQTLILKKVIKFNLDVLVLFLSFFICIIFMYNFVVAMYNFTFLTIKSKRYYDEYKVKVDDGSDTPNIYWIHCDGMMSIDTVDKYYSYYNYNLVEYFKKNDYNYNNSASFEGGHRTQKALVALFNPNYYDNFYSDYLANSSKYDVHEINIMPYYVDYYELLRKRLKNELFDALDKKKYTKFAIAEYNPYSSLDVDYFYDYFVYNGYYVGSEPSLRLLKNNSDFRLKSYTSFEHLKAVLYQTMLYKLVDLNYLNYDIVDLNDVDVSNYKYVYDNYYNKNYWLNMAIMKGLNDSMNVKNNKFVFVDFRLNHDPFAFDMYGDYIDEGARLFPVSYSGNYAYSSLILIDILNFIRDKDPNAVIVVQSDHGLHTMDDKEMMSYFNVDLYGVQEIRNSVINAVYVPSKYRNGDEKYLGNPLNISRYLVNNFVGYNYNYLEDGVN